MTEMESDLAKEVIAWRQVERLKQEQRAVGSSVGMDMAKSQARLRAQLLASNNEKKYPEVK